MARPSPSRARTGSANPPPRTPQSLGFRMPAEWEPHEATWLAWPHHRQDWPGKFASIPGVIAEIVRHLHRHELVHIVAGDARKEQRASDVLDRVGVDLSRVEFHRFATDRSWLRDSGPVFVTNGREAGATCWRFNGWARYHNWKKDSRLAGKIAAATGRPRFSASLEESAGGAGGRKHRRERVRYAADDRGVFARREASP